MFVGVDQIPVDVFDLVYGVDDLQTESHIRKFAIVFGDANETRIRRKSKPLQKRLRERHLKARVELRAQGREKAVRGLSSIGETYVQVHAPLKRLVVGKVNRSRVLNQAAARKHALKNAACLLAEVIFLQGSGDDGVKARDRRPEAEGGTDQAVGTGADAANSQAGAAGGSPSACPDPAHAAAGSVLHDASVDAEDAGAGFRAQHVGIGNVQVVAGDRYIEVVLER